MLIKSRNIPNAYDTLLRRVWTEGHYIIDQRGNQIKEIEDVMISIDINNITFPNFGPTTKRFGDDFAEGLISDSIAYSKGKVFEYAYGERIRTGNALEEVLTMLKEDSSTRRAVLSIYHPDDVRRANNGYEVPCVTQLYLRIRNGKLNMTLMMRSNDIVSAFPSDIYGFMRFQESIAALLKIKIGTYTQFIGSAHIIMNNDGDFIRKHILTPRVWY